MQRDDIKTGCTLNSVFDEGVFAAPKHRQKRRRRVKDVTRRILPVFNTENSAVFVVSKEETAALLRNEVQSPYAPEKHAGGPVARKRTTRDHEDRDDIRRGPFTSTENSILKESIDLYFKKQGWTSIEGWKELGLLAAKKRKKQITDHWCEIASCLPQRPVVSIQRHAQRTLAPWKHGAWSLEETLDLVQLVKSHGPRWVEFCSTRFNRPPNAILAKWRELEPIVRRSEDALAAVTAAHSNPQRHRWTLEQDLQLLAAIEKVTGVALPVRAVPWRFVQRELDFSFPPNTLAQRYKDVLFPAILATKYNGATPAVVMRQMIRYVRTSLQENLIRDVSEVEPRRIIPFWYSLPPRRNINRLIKRAVPAHITTFKDQIDYLWDLLGCSERERYDLRRLAKTYSALLAINGALPLKKGRRMLSDDHWTSHAADVLDTWRASAETEELDRLRKKANLAAKMKGSGSSSSNKENVEAAASMNITAEDRVKERLLKMNGSEPVELLAPRSVESEKLNAVVPANRRHVPEAFSRYLLTFERARRKMEASRELKKVDIEAKIGSFGGEDYLDFHIFRSMGVDPRTVVADSGKGEEFWKTIGEVSDSIEQDGPEAPFQVTENEPDVSNDAQRQAVQMFSDMCERKAPTKPKLLSKVNFRKMRPTWVT